jgi:hypothetical protein
LPSGSTAFHVTTVVPSFVTVIVLPETVAANVALGPFWMIGSLIERCATTSAVTFSQVGVPFATPLSTANGWQTRSWLTRYGLSTPENPPNVSATAGVATSKSANGKADRIAISTL